jgi:hypothetical protein
VSLEHSARVAYAREILAKTEATADNYGEVVAQKLELRAALEQALAVIDGQAAQLVRRDADGEAMDRYRAYMRGLPWTWPAEIRRPVIRP